jgi:hypothetical protein
MAALFWRSSLLPSLALFGVLELDSLNLPADLPEIRQSLALKLLKSQRIPGASLAGGSMRRKMRGVPSRCSMEFVPVVTA